MNQKLTVVRAVYREIKEGDIRKLQAESNDDPNAGGGARDLRFPKSGFDTVLRQIFTGNVTGARSRAIRVATVSYLDKSGVSKTTKLEYWPPTASRPTEVRIAKIHESPALGGQKLPDTDRGRVFVLFTQYSNGVIRVDYAYEDDLRKVGIWADEIRNAILDCLENADQKNRLRSKNTVTAQGYFDFLSGTGYCHGQ